MAGFLAKLPMANGRVYSRVHMFNLKRNRIRILYQLDILSVRDRVSRCVSDTTVTLLVETKSLFSIWR